MLTFAVKIDCKQIPIIIIIIIIIAIIINNKKKSKHIFHFTYYFHFFDLGRTNVSHMHDMLPSDIKTKYRIRIIIIKIHFDNKINLGH